MITVKINIRSEFLKVINNYKFVLLSLFILIKINLYSQNLYDLDHSAKYASFLYSTNQFKLAAVEYERLVFLDTANTEFKIKLISTYRKSNNLKRGIERIPWIVNCFWGSIAFLGVKVAMGILFFNGCRQSDEERSLYGEYFFRNGEEKECFP